MLSDLQTEERDTLFITTNTSLQFDEHDFLTSYLRPNFHIHFMPDQALISPPGEQLYWDLPETTMRYKKQMSEGRLPNAFAIYPSKHASRQTVIINDTGRDIYSFIDGTRTVEDIYKAVIEKNHESYEKFQESIYNFLRNVVGYKHAFLSKTKQFVPYTFTGSEEYFVPVHASFEVTACCNARCKHCYGAFETIRDDMLSLSTVLNLLNKLRELGIRTIELTGGECTTHPDFSQILEECVHLFDLVAILTNGIDIDDHVFDIVERSAPKLLAQICINGKPEYHDSFVQYKGAFEKSTRNLTRFAERGVLIRVGMNLTGENGDDIDFVLNHTRENGASTFAPSWVNMGQGRATSLPCSSCSHDIIESQHLHICELEKQYPGFVCYHIDKQSLEMSQYNQSCGVGRRTIYITSDGFCHLCPMTIGTGIPGYGTIDSLFEKGNWDTPFIREIYKLPAPNSTDCKNCELMHTCLGCITRGIQNYLQNPERCQWGKDNNLNTLLQQAVFQK